MPFSNLIDAPGGQGSFPVLLPATHRVLSNTWEVFSNCLLHEKSVLACSKCGLQSSILSITWDLVRRAESWTYIRSIESESAFWQDHRRFVGLLRFRKCCLVCPPHQPIAERPTVITMEHAFYCCLGYYILSVSINPFLQALTTSHLPSPWKEPLSLLLQCEKHRSVPDAGPALPCTLQGLQSTGQWMLTSAGSCCLSMSDFLWEMSNYPPWLRCPPALPLLTEIGGYMKSESKGEAVTMA